MLPADWGGNQNGGEILQLDHKHVLIMATTKNSQSADYYTRPRGVKIAFALLGFIHLIPSLTNIPVFPQLLVSSCACVYIGCQFASKIRRSTGGELAKTDKHQSEETVTKADALKFPITASCVLFGLYVLYKYVSPTLVNLLLTVQFSILTIVSVSGLVMPLFDFSQESKKPLFTLKPPNWLKKALDIPDIEASKASLLMNLLCAIPVGLYFVTRHWLLNNFFGILFSVVAIRAMNLGSFQIGFILLWLLFIYDIFWVYGTDVMVTVAKNLDIPIKLLFPYQNEAGEQKFSMLGLGDIVIPGVFVSVCLKYDIDRAIRNKLKNLSDLRLPYFNTCFVGYILGIVVTFATLLLTRHAQPALLFLVPSCTLTVLVLALCRNELRDMKEYQTDPKPKKES